MYIFGCIQSQHSWSAGENESLGYGERMCKASIPHCFSTATSTSSAWTVTLKYKLIWVQKNLPPVHTRGPHKAYGKGMYEKLVHGV